MSDHEVCIWVTVPAANNREAVGIVSRQFGGVPGPARVTSYSTQREPDYESNPPWLGTSYSLCPECGGQFFSDGIHACSHHAYRSTI